MNNQAILAICAAALLLTTGCATAAGFGDDVQSAGKAITKTSDDVKE
ncbi:entericidin EcnA/B family protein [Sandarakinorhabdus rubra]|nr:entericidin EcnA/B family protein [Sandarakinorhabdus rubra]